MQPLTFNCEIITPMFAGSALPGDCELRPPAIKGALRFWWRAMNGHLSISDLRKREAEIFGSSDEDNGRSKVTVEVELLTSFQPQIPKFSERKENNDRPIVTDLLGTSKKVIAFYSGSSKDFPSNILEYLSYGLHDYVKAKKEIVFHRPCFNPGEKFRVIFRLKDDSLIKMVEDVFKVFAWFGGLGAKTRNGFGQICILNDDGQPEFKEQPSLGEHKTELSSWTSINKHVRVFQKSLQKHNKWDVALSEIGWAYRESRLSLDMDNTNGLNGKGKHNYENRLYLAQPIIVQGKSIPNLKERHSKTYFLFINKIGKDNFQSGILHLPYDYLKDCFDYDKTNWNATKNCKSNPKDRYDEVHAVMNKQLKIQLT